VRIKVSVVKLVTPIAVFGLVSALMGSGYAAPQQAQSKAPLVIGQINSETSPNTPGRLTGGADTLKAWVKMVNAKGGINGHKVVLKTADDGNDAAKASAAVKKLIEQDHVIAIVSPGTSPATETVWGKVAIAAGVPVVGGSAYANDWGTDPDFFPATTSGQLNLVWGFINAVEYTGEKTFGITYDAQFPQTQAAGPVFKQLAARNGLTLTDNLAVNISAADYTAPCVTFKQGNAGAIVTLTSGAELTRFARDCARQNYYPVYISGDGNLTRQDLVKNPNVKREVASVYSFPYLIKNTPATKEFHDAMAKYAPKALKGDYPQGTTQVWTGAKLFEAAARNITADTPTAQDVKNALFTIKDDDLGGLASIPLTFTQGQLTNVPCWFRLEVKNHKVLAPVGMKTQCAPPS
jgi:branched-chain amino acid transport system substrate-binding protein